ncbi:MAG: hypothetical protein HQL15_07525 [Candidatus Omnitrophica bacterium]|nr:hypothetical protein [Candidatus Omnitrophota bacterium]
MKTQHYTTSSCGPILRGREGQSALEYLLILTVVAIIALAAFNKLIPEVRKSQASSTGFFKSVTRSIIGGEGNNPMPIDGKWCDSDATTAYAPHPTCECPAPAFGGKPCPAL